MNRFIPATAVLVVTLTRAMASQVSSVFCASTKNHGPVAAGSNQPQKFPLVSVRHL
jgi:hypothetical protein